MWDSLVSLQKRVYSPDCKSLCRNAGCLLAGPAVSLAAGGRSSSPAANEMRSCWRRSHKTRTKPQQPARPARAREEICSTTNLIYNLRAAKISYLIVYDL